MPKKADLDQETDLPTKDEPVLYDITKPQRISFTITKNGRDFPVAHVLNPLTNARYFDFQEQVTQMAERLKKLTTSIYEPKDALWLELVDSREGYKERDDWKAATHQSDRLAAINAFLHTQILDDSEIDVENKDELFDDDDLTTISFNVMYNGGLLTGMTHSFRQETKLEMNAFLALETDEPNPNTLASAVKKSKAEKLYDLGKGMLRESTGYEDPTQIPAWHLAVTTETFFLRQIARAGK